MFTKLPAELRTLIYQYVLLEDAPLIIEYWDRAAVVRHEQPTSITYNTRGWSVLSVTRQSRHEGLCILLSNSHFICFIESPGAEDYCDFFSIYLHNQYLPHIKYISFAIVSGDWHPCTWYDWAEYRELVDAMLLLNLFYSWKVRLERLVIVNAQSQNRWSIAQTPLQVTAILLPLAMRYYVNGFAHQLFVGETFASKDASSVDDDYEAFFEESTEPRDPTLWTREIHLHRLYSLFETETRTQPCFVTYRAWFRDHPRPFSTRSGLWEHKIKFRQDGIPVSQDLMISSKSHILGYGTDIWGRYGTWYGETMCLDQFDVSPCHEVISWFLLPACLVRLRWYTIEQRYPWQPTPRHLPIQQHEYENQVEISWQEFVELQEAQSWFEMWWAAHLKGQRKITEWLRSDLVE